jgi:hypothetical protein
LNYNKINWHSLYKDLPSKQQKVVVPDKSKIVCSEDETLVLTPFELQQDLDRVMKNVVNGRCFIRPSGFFYLFILLLFIIIISYYYYYHYFFNHIRKYKNY